MLHGSHLFIGLSLYDAYWMIDIYILDIVIDYIIYGIV